MTDKELKRLKRSEMMELLLMQSREIDNLKSKLAQAEEKIESRRLELSDIGSIAEAAMQLSRVFETAQTAADIYLENVANLEEKAQSLEAEIQGKCDAMEAESQAKCQAWEQEAREKCESLERETQQRCETMDSETRISCLAMERESREKCETMEKEAQIRCQSLEAEVRDRCETMESETRANCMAQEEESRQTSSRIIQEAQEQSKKFWEQTERQLYDYVIGHQELKSLIQECQDNINLSGKRNTGE